ncbi:sigma 54-interacting transcriptional regulator [Oscillibacter valericigenes]|uniref:sigma 54-interacting transcriptional regulator n=1 Tax=Oscillibacter valericigenes TaxID=351091 RepID=UPI001F19E800|nr:sigma 54-interacting transcriptional regulator [Oscillibacter valericigenes]MCF2663621.1 sigma 54-interacting transcriptional regulator [Oscillibacter valericigenes]
MVNVIVFVPSPSQLSYVEGLVRDMQTDEVHIDVVHRFGSPEILNHLDSYDVVLARGITYRMVCAQYPGKHVIHLAFDGTDILEALLHCREDFHPKKIGLCLKRDELKPVLAALCEFTHADIRLYEVVDEQSAYDAVDACQRDRVDAVVSGGTVSDICQKRGMPCTYINIRPATLERAMQEVLNTARTINTERTKTNIIRMILDNSDDAVLAVDETGRVLEANGQAYQLYQLAFLHNWQGLPVRDINPQLSFIGSREAPCRDGEETIINLGGQKYYVKYKLISGEASGIGTLITTSSASKILQEERQLRKSLVRKSSSVKYTFRDIIAVNPEMQKKVEIAKKFSQAHSNVLITGETGTGKELFAHSIHAASGRMNQPFVAINCATLPENLLESELFGYEPGSFSGASREGKAGLFELAHHGTIFLDEIGEIPVALQAKLLRVLQEKEIRRIGSAATIPIDVRVIAATNVNIQEQIAQGRFRSDLLYRLNALEIYIPPLRERPDDVIPLMEGQLRILAAEQGKKVPKLSAEAQDILRLYAWPGNVRELRNICERLVVLNDSSDVDVETLNELHVFSGSAQPSPALQHKPAATLVPPPAKKKKDLARELGVSRTTLWRMSKRQEAVAQKKDQD